MNPSNLSLFTRILATLFCFGIAQAAIAGSGGITSKDFGRDRTIVFANSSDIELTLSAKVVSKAGEPFSDSGEGAIPISAEIFHAHIDAEQEAAGPNVRALIDSYDKKEEEYNKKEGRRRGEEELVRRFPIPDQEVKVAATKDEERKKALRKALEDEHKRVGLKWNPDTECVVHFFSGKAVMTILEVYQGDIKVDDKIDISWKNIHFRWSCPPILPFDGKCGWIFEGAVKNGDQITLGHGFFERKQAIEALAAYKKRAEQGGAGQAPTRPESK